MNRISKKLLCFLRYNNTKTVTSNDLCYLLEASFAVNRQITVSACITGKPVKKEEQ